MTRCTNFKVGAVMMNMMYMIEKGGDRKWFSDRAI